MVRIPLCVYLVCVIPNRLIRWMIMVVVVVVILLIIIIVIIFMKIIIIMRERIMVVIVVVEIGMNRPFQSMSNPWRLFYHLDHWIKYYYFPILILILLWRIPIRMMIPIIPIMIPIVMSIPISLVTVVPFPIQNNDPLLLFVKVIIIFITIIMLLGWEE